jgi:hypothetical protein
VVITGAEDEEYRLSVDDIDSSLVFMYTPVTEQGAKGEPQYKYTGSVKAGAWVANLIFFFQFAFVKVCLDQFFFLYVDVLSFLHEYAWLPLQLFLICIFFFY